MSKIPVASKMVGQARILDGEALLDAALAALAEHGVEFKRVAAGAASGPYDAYLRTVGTRPATYAVDLKHVSRPAAPRSVRPQPPGNTRNLLVAPYVAPALARRLKADGIEFIDAAGNAYLERPGHLIWIVGQKPLSSTPKTFAAGRAFSASGLRVLFALLCDPDRLNEPYRAIAEQAGVAHGTVGWVMPDLIKQGFVAELRGRRRLVDGRRLLDLWVDAFLQRLRPKLLLGRFEVPDLGLLDTLDPHAHEFQVGGEFAARDMTGYLRPGSAVLYADRVPPRLIAALRLERSPRGNLDLVKRFWNFATGELRVPDVLVYADLLQSNDARARETAGIIRDGIVVRFK